MTVESGSRGVWSNRDFLKLWAGETVSLLGSQVTALALPLTAVLSLGASPAQMGYLSAARFVPFLLLTLPAGVWIDHRRRRPVLVAANLGRALMVGLVPVLAAVKALHLVYLYPVAFLIGSLTVLFDLAYQSYLPSLVTREHLVDGNSKLQVSAAAAEVGGPGLAGWLVAHFSAPLALAADAASFLVSTLGISLIRRREPEPEQGGDNASLLQGMRTGLQVVYGDRRLRAIALEAATYNLFGIWIETLFVLYAVRVLGIGPGPLGVIMATGSVGTLLGAVLARPWAQQLGLGRSILGSMVLACVAPILLPLTRASVWTSIPLLVISFFAGGVGLAVSNIHVVSLRQAVTPDHLLGRMNASYRLLVYGGIPLGALLGGTAGQWLGVRTALAMGAVGLLLAPLWVWWSPVPSLVSTATAADNNSVAPAASPLSSVDR